jgi:1-deoxy-D-xylulose 5-phosphate reductoisomerase
MTSRVIPIRIGETELLVETTTVGGTEPTSRLRDATERAVDAFMQAQIAIVDIACATMQSIERMSALAARPDSLEVEFALKFSAQGNVIVASGSGEAALKVKLRYGGPTQNQSEE